MCLACHPSLGAHGKEAIAALFDLSPITKLLNATEEEVKAISSVTGNVLHTPNNKELYLTKEQIQEIIENALVVIATGVDTRVDIWAIQWPRGYVVKTIRIVSNN